MKKLLILFCSLLLNGVFGDVDEVSVKNGDSVTLKIKPEDINGATDLVWKFNVTNIAKIDLQGKNTPPVYPNERFKNRLNLERQTGSLTITNIRSQHSGEYQLEIIGSGGIKYKRCRVSVIGEDSGVYDVSITGDKKIEKKLDVTKSSQRSNGEKTGPGSLVVLILMGIFLIH